MSFLTRFIPAFGHAARPRFLSSAFLQYHPRKDQVYGFPLLRGCYSTGAPPFGNAQSHFGDARTPTFNGNAMIAAAAIGIGGLGAYAFNLLTGNNQQASCGEKDKKSDGACEKQCEDSTCLHKMDKEEEVISKANADLEIALKDIKPKAMKATEEALTAYCEAAIIIKQFMDKAYCAMEKDGIEPPEFEETWCAVFDLALKRCEKVKEALKKAQCAWELLCKLREVIDNGKACKYTSCNPLLITAEEALLCAERELLNGRAKMDCVQSDSVMVEQYRDLIAKFREELKAEMAKNPDPQACKLSDDECGQVLFAAYKKVMRVQKELAQVQVGMGKVPSKQSVTMC